MTVARGSRVQHHSAARQVQAAGARGRAQASQNHDTVCLMRINDLSHARDGGVRSRPRRARIINHMDYPDTDSHWIRSSIAN